MKYLKGSLKVEIKGCITENVYDFYNFIFNTGIKRFHIVKQKIKIYNDKCDTYVAIKFINITLDVSLDYHSSIGRRVTEDGSSVQTVGISGITR